MKKAEGAMMWATRAGATRVKWGGVERSVAWAVTAEAAGADEACSGV